ncbi:MAG: type I 3-dehydroquinate dehydratase [Nitrospirota bacterium]|nr:type I 3-dehydroquinate dehydratase [Nitrospirota bacterium]
MRPDFKRPAIAGAASDSDLKYISEDILKALDLIELRIDHFSSLTDGHIVDVFKKAEALGKPLIATVRSTEEGGQRDISDSERIRLFNLTRNSTDFIDIEARAEIFDKVMNLARDAGITLIASYHNFEGTPSYDELSGFITEYRERGADIVKIATTANSKDDLRTMTRLTLDHYQEGIVSICMGVKGLISRLFFPSVGSLFTFASIGNSKAPGQIPVLELRKYMEALIEG